jgi:hypothetical protein
MNVVAERAIVEIYVMGVSIVFIIYSDTQYVLFYYYHLFGHLYLLEEYLSFNDNYMI